MLPMEKGSHRPHSILVVSERLDGHKADWHDIAANHYLIVTGDFEIMQRPVKDHRHQGRKPAKKAATKVKKAFNIKKK
jgi:hypothetical protein